MLSNEELIRAVLDGRHAAFAELVRRYERAAWVTAWKVLRDYHAAQDATQNAFIAAYRQLGGLRHPKYFGAWLLRITQREALRLGRRQERTTPLGHAGAVCTAEDGAARKDVNDALLTAIGSLPEHERLVVTLRYLGGNSVAEVAAVTGRPIGTVTKQLSRALGRLHSILKEVPT